MTVHNGMEATQAVKTCARKKFHYLAFLANNAQFQRVLITIAQMLAL
jgi:hypothetical protein